MESFVLIAQIIVMLSLSALAIYLVVLLIKVKDMLGVIEVNIKEVSARAIPVLENMEAITGKLRTITDSIDDQMVLTRNSLKLLYGVTENIARFERNMQNLIEGPLMEFASIVGGFIGRIAKFLHSFSRK